VAQNVLDLGAYRLAHPSWVGLPTTSALGGRSVLAPLPGSPLRWSQSMFPPTEKNHCSPSNQSCEVGQGDKIQAACAFLSFGPSKTVTKAGEACWVHWRNREAHFSLPATKLTRIVAKIAKPNPRPDCRFTGEPVRVLAVKGSGADVGSIMESGFAISYPERLQHLKKLHRGE
jgi:hypothetical protein